LKEACQIELFIDIVQYICESLGKEGRVTVQGREGPKRREEKPVEITRGVEKI